VTAAKQPRLPGLETSPWELVDRRRHAGLADREAETLAARGEERRARALAAQAELAICAADGCRSATSDPSGVCSRCRREVAD
jgi:hypothetical protein